MSHAYQVLGISKQAHHQHRKRAKARGQIGELIRRFIQAERAAHPGCGLKKLHHLMPACPVGRDEFIALATGMGLALKRRRKASRTTFSVFSTFTNLVAGRTLDGTDQVWASDITYLKVGQRDAYLVLIEDVYSRRIVGYCVSHTLAASQNVRALRMAFRTRRGQPLGGLIHHSDRGSQYVAGCYLDLLWQRGIQVSMCHTALDNAYAERLNGIVKNEYLDHCDFATLAELSRQLNKVVKHYNERRLHLQLGMLAPVAYERLLENTPVSQRTKLIIAQEHT